VLGWLVAFTVSFVGHHLLTFRGHGAALRSAATRFFIVSAGGFAINEATYAVLLGWMARRYDVALALVLVAVAVLTYLLSRHWAFLRNPAR
jgi:putative flippase GtrA